MENEEAKHSGVISTVSRCTGAGLGKVAKVGGTVKTLLTRPVDDFEVALDENEQDEATSQRPALEQESEKTIPKADKLVGKITSLEAELDETRNLLAEAKSNAEKMQSEFASQLNTLQAEKESLIFDLEQATKEINESKSTEATLRARVAALELELDAAKGKSEKPTDPLIHAKPLLSDTSVTQIEQNPDISETITAPQNDAKAEKVIDIDEQLSQPLVNEPDISVSEEVENIEAEKAEKEFATVQTEQEVDSSTETTAAQSDENVHIETEAHEFGPVTSEISSSVPADVTIEEADAADFNAVTEKIIFIKALSDMTSQNKTTRIDAVRTMAGIRHELSVRALIAQMSKEPTAQIRAECIKALANLNMKEGLPAIEQALTEKTALVRLAAVRGLYRLAGEKSVATLVRMLCDEDEDVRRRTTSCIGWLGKEELAVELAPLLDDSSVSVRRTAVEAMGNLGCRKVVSDLINHLSDPEKMVRKAVITALKAITGKKMSGQFPRDKKSLHFLVLRWKQWWEDEQKVFCQK